MFCEEEKKREGDGGRERGVMDLHRARHDYCVYGIRTWSRKKRFGFGRKREELRREIPATREKWIEKDKVWMDRRCWGSKTDKKWGIGKGSGNDGWDGLGGMVWVTDDKRHNAEKSSRRWAELCLYR